MTGPGMRLTSALVRLAYSSRSGAQSGYCTSLRAVHNQSSMTSSYTPRRALLYVPASSEKMLTKVPQIQVDCLVLELEDGVALASKATARTNIRVFLDQQHHTMACGELGVRVNSVASQLIKDDVAEVSKANALPDAFMVPKIDSVDDLYEVSRIFRHFYGDRLLKSRRRLVLWIESAVALLNVVEILRAAVGMESSVGLKTDAVVFGSDDYCADIGATRTSAGEECQWARQRFVAACKAFELQAIDSVYIDVTDPDGLALQSQQGYNWGFTGKQVIHPSQIPPNTTNLMSISTKRYVIVQKNFLPSEEKQRWAHELILQYEAHSNTGKGAFIFEGHMIDRPLLLQARNIVDMMTKVKIN